MLKAIRIYRIQHGKYAGGLIDMQGSYNNLQVVSRLTH